MKIILVGCGKRKSQIDPCPAEWLYTGCLTRAAIGYAKASRRPWFIVSAHYSLVAPSTLVRPYDFSIGDMDAAGRVSWAASVAGAVSAMGVERVEAHMGREYMRYLRPAFDRLGVETSTPLDGLEVGMRLQWYKLQRAA